VRMGAFKGCHRSVDAILQHTSASLLIKENAARAVRSDLETFRDPLPGENRAEYEHDDGGPATCPTPRTAMTGVHLSIPVLAGQLRLGTWQGI